jgi:hypothetical protein
LGFKRVVYLVSFGYALSMEAQTLLLPTVFGGTLSGWALVQSALMPIYSFIGV